MKKKKALIVYKETSEVQHGNAVMWVYLTARGKFIQRRNCIL